MFFSGSGFRVRVVTAGIEDWRFGIECWLGSSGSSG